MARLDVSTRQQHNKRWEWPIHLAFLCLLVLLSLSIGAYDLRADDAQLSMFFITRLPRTLALLLAGAGMAVSGQLIQMVSQNKYIEATTTGTMEWAGLGLLLVYIFIPSASLWLRMTGAIVASFIGTFAFFLFLKQLAFKSATMVPIVGLVIGAVVSALTTFLSLATQKSQAIESWFHGSFAQVQIGRYEYLWVVLFVCLMAYAYANHLTVVGLGKAIATNLGVNYERIILITTVLIALLVGVIAAVIGRLPFIGLIVANVVSMAKGDDVKDNLKWVALFGMDLILICDLISRTIIHPFELSVSLILSVIGTFFFIFLILQQRRVHSD